MPAAAAGTGGGAALRIVRAPLSKSVRGNCRPPGEFSRKTGMISDRRPSAGGLLAGAVFKFGPQRGNAQLEVGAESGHSATSIPRRSSLRASASIRVVPLETAVRPTAALDDFRLWAVGCGLRVQAQTRHWQASPRGCPDRPCDGPSGWPATNVRQRDPQARDRWSAFRRAPRLRRSPAGISRTSGKRSMARSPPADQKPGSA